jgi:flagellar basal body-associated protein FliL
VGAVLTGGVPVLAAAPHHEQEEEGKPAPPAGPAFVKMLPINVPIINGNRVSAQVGISLSLELVDGKTADDLEDKLPVLQDAFIKDLYVIFQQRIDQGRPLSGELIKSRLLLTAGRVVGQGIVKSVLIEQMFEQPMR